MKKVSRVGRRQFLAGALLTPAFALAQRNPPARFVRTIPLGNPTGANTTPLERLLGSGLSARLFTDLSTLAPTAADTLVTPNDRFFVRTAAPSALPDAAAWTINVGGFVAKPGRITLASFEPLVSHAGRYLIECSGNTDPANYGLLSTAEWDGVPLAAVLDRSGPRAGASRVLVSGVDDEVDRGGTSVPGASWIFSRDDVRRAILATRMNGAPLPRDHGAPVRLIVPGWYGCACIKWVNRIEVVADDAPATTQMREFAARTHQPLDTSAATGPSGARAPALARDYVPAVIDTAAAPVRVEQWTGGGRTFYRLVGIMWGGSKPTNALSIRFRPDLPWVRVEACPLPQSTDAWTIWTHTWRPESPGRYTIVLRVDNPAIRTRRLDIFFYARDVQIADV